MGVEVAKKTESSTESRRLRGKGKRKIDIKKVEGQKKLAVCFSKRRKGLFKKASEISSICGAETAVVVFHSNGKVYSAGDVEGVFDRFVFGKRERFWWEMEPEEVMPERLGEFESAVVELKKRVDAEIVERRNNVVNEPELYGGGDGGCSSSTAAIVCSSSAVFDSRSLCSSSAIVSVPASDSTTSCPSLTSSMAVGDSTTTIGYSSSMAAGDSAITTGYSSSMAVCDSTTTTDYSTMVGCSSSTNWLTDFCDKFLVDDVEEFANSDELGFSPF